MKIKKALESLLKYSPESHYSFDILDSEEQMNKEIKNTYIKNILDDNINDDNFQNEINKNKISKKQNKETKSNDENTNTQIFPSLPINLDFIKSKYNFLINSDIVIREFTLNARNKQYNAFVIYIDGMVSSEIMDNFVLRPLMIKDKANSYDGNHSIVINEALTNNITVKKVKKFNLGEYIMSCLMPQNSVTMEDTFENVITGINSR